MKSPPKWPAQITLFTWIILPCNSVVFHPQSRWDPRFKIILLPLDCDVGPALAKHILSQQGTISQISQPSLYSVMDHPCLSFLATQRTLTNKNLLSGTLADCLISFKLAADIREIHPSLKKRLKLITRNSLSVKDLLFANKNSWLFLFWYLWCLWICAAPNSYLSVLLWDYIGAKTSFLLLILLPNKLIKLGLSPHIFVNQVLIPNSPNR